MPAKQKEQKNLSPEKEENILNVPNFLTIARIFLTFVVVYMIFTNAKIKTIVITFAIAAITDFLDGQIARRFNQTTEFGRKADIIADRFLWAGTALAFIFAFGLEGKLTPFHGAQILMIMSREIIALPFAIGAFFTGKGLPQTRTIGKVNTFIQGFALPSLIASIQYPKFLYLSVPLSIILAFTGVTAALFYMYDLKKMHGGKNVRTRRRKN